MSPSALHSVALRRESPQSDLDRWNAERSGWHRRRRWSRSIAAICRSRRGRRVSQQPAAQSTVVLVKPGGQLSGDQIRRVRSDQSQQEAAIVEEVLAHEPVHVRGGGCGRRARLRPLSLNSCPCQHIQRNVTCLLKLEMGGNRTEPR